MDLLTDREVMNIENHLKKDTDNSCKEKAIEQYAFYKCCVMGIEKVIPELKKYGFE